MIVINNLASLDRIHNLELRNLVQLRFQQLNADDDLQKNAQLIVAELGDTLAELEEQGGCLLLTNWLDGTQFGNPEFTPMSEVIEEHAGCCFEMGFVLNDDGFSVIFFIPKEIIQQLNPDQLEHFEERAGIAEYDGKLPRAHAECLALLEVLQRY